MRVSSVFKKYSLSPLYYGGTTPFYRNFFFSNSYFILFLNSIPLILFIYFNFFYFSLAFRKASSPTDFLNTAPILLDDVLVNVLVKSTKKLLEKKVKFMLPRFYLTLSSIFSFIPVEANTAIYFFCFMLFSN